MSTRVWSVVAATTFILALAAWGQEPAAPLGGALTARVETTTIELTPPDKYAVALVLEPSRRVAVVAPTDGALRSIDVGIGESVREGKGVAQLDRAEASALLKIARAEVKEKEAAVKASNSAVTQAHLEAAQARAELAQLAVERCTLKAPFTGRVLDLPVSAGQYVAKGATVAEVADVSSLRALLPVNRAATKAGSTLDLSVEGKPAKGKVKALLPLPERFAALRDLATPWAAAWLDVENTTGALEPGQRVRNPFLPAAPVATLPARAVREGSEGAGTVQVLRDEYVADVPVRVLGEVGPERLQVSGAFRPNDAVIVESTVPLAAGTLVHFGGGAASPASADITPPAAAPRVAPIGAPGSAAPKTTARSPADPGRGPAPAKKEATRPTPAPTPAKGAVPF